jgi:heterotetrameric sarcosine oxidase delta subunit
MLLIHCPYCEEERPELEFRHAGEAHIARPGRYRQHSDDAFAKYFFYRDNPKGITFERWRHIHGCGALLQRGARHGLRQVRDDLQGRRTEAGYRRGRQ